MLRRFTLGALIASGAFFILTSSLVSTYSADASGAAGTPYSSYSRTSEFAQRLQLLEFSDKSDAKCGELTRLLAEMRNKNYPIQRVERRNGGETLYSQYKIETIPTFVLLFDGKELGRVVVKKDSVRATRDRLLKLFQHGRDAVARHPRVRAPEPEYHAASKPLFGFLFQGAGRDAAVARGQALGLSSSEPAEDYSFLDAREEELSKLIGESRLNAGAARVEVESPDGGAPRVGDGVTIHYNSEYKEALVAVAASLFVGIDDAFNKARVMVEVYSSEAQTLEKRGAQCVYCDMESGIAFVAAQVDHPATPVAFLPKKTPLEVGERATLVMRDGENVVKSGHDVLALDQRRFYKTAEGADQSAAFLCVEISDAPSAEHNGAGLFVERNERYYFAGLYLSGTEHREGVVAPIALISRSLLVNRNLATVYRDQIAGKFDSAASDAEIDSAISKLVRLDATKRAQAQAQAKADLETLAKEAQENPVKLSQPTDAPRVDARMDLVASDVVTSDPSRVDAALAAAARTEPVETANAFPANARDAFAQSDALANAIAERQTNEVQTAGINENFVFAQNNQPETKPETVPQVAAPNPLDDAKSQEQALAQNPLPTAPIQNTTPELPAVNPPLPTPNLNEALAQTATNAQETNVPEPNVSAQTPANAQTLAATTTQTNAQPTNVVNANANQAPTIAQAPIATSAQDVQQIVEPVEAHESAQIAAATSTRYAAYDGLPTPNSDVIRSTTYSALPDLAQIEIFDREEEQFEAAIDALRRRSMEGAEIICIVNWSSDPSAPRETEVVRLPKRTALENPRNPKANVELVSKPTPNGAQTTANLPNSRIVK